MRRHLRSEIVKLPRVHRPKKGGKVYKYHKITRAPLPRDVPEDHPTFIAAWTAEEAKRPHERSRAPSGSIADAVTRYLRSAQYKDLSKEYAAIISRNVRTIYQDYGKAQLHQLRSSHIDQDLSCLLGQKRVNRRKAWRQLGTFWKDAQLVVNDPSEGIMSVKAVKGRGHSPWSSDQVQAFRSFWPVGSVQRLAFELLFWTGARTVDAVTLGPRMVGPDGLLTLTQSKSGNPAHVPWYSTLPAWGGSMEADRQALMECLPKTVFTFLETSTGKPRSKKGLSNVISKAARKAGIEERSAHGLRKSRLTIMAELGAPVEALQSWGGHKTLAEVQKYIESANRKKVLIGTEQDQNVVNHIDFFGKMAKK
ncbi:MAG: tyrosine-type recombinase/integrase [Pseudomonadota bacterium]